jgi:hypothetical protein
MDSIIDSQPPEDIALARKKVLAAFADPANQSRQGFGQPVSPCGNYVCAFALMQEALGIPYSLELGAIYQTLGRLGLRYASVIAWNDRANMSFAQIGRNLEAEWR